MLYTVGNTESYERALKENPSVAKVGMSEGYPGGSVFLTYKQAEEAIKNMPEYSIYGLETDIGNTHVRIDEQGKQHRHLFRDANIVSLTKQLTWVLED